MSGPAPATAVCLVWQIKEMVSRPGSAWTVTTKSFLFRLVPLTLAATISGAWLLANTASAQAYPVKPVRYIVPFAPGGSPDIVARLLSDRISRLWGQQLVVDNRAGAAGTLGAAISARAAPDGYTLFQCNIASNAIAASQYLKLPYDVLRDFAPITRIGSTPNALVVHPAVPAATLAEFIAHAKAYPGKLSYGTSGQGSSPHLSMELFSTLSGIKVVHIAYKGAAPALADLMAGQIAAVVSNIPALLSLAQAGRIRVLAVTGAQRLPQWPAVPTMIESGFPGYDVNSWYGVCAPAATPAPLLSKLHADFTRVLQAPDVRQRLSELVVEVTPTSPEVFAAFIGSETKRWIQVARNAGITPQ